MMFIYDETVENVRFFISTFLGIITAVGMVTIAILTWEKQENENRAKDFCITMERKHTDEKS